MINLSRHQSYFNPINIVDTIHIIGVGAVGSHVANFLTRLGIRKIHLWDFDNVDEHNIPNQLFTYKDIGQPKKVALKEYLEKINPDIQIILHDKYVKQQLQGYIFCCVDHIDTRLTLYTENEFNVNIKAIFDTRIGLGDGQVFSANWSDADDIANLIAVSSFPKEEVEVPTSACGTRLTVLPTVVVTASNAVANFINLIKQKKLKRQITFNAFEFTSRGI